MMFLQITTYCPYKSFALNTVVIGFLIAEVPLIENGRGKKSRLFVSGGYSFNTLPFIMLTVATFEANQIVMLGLLSCKNHPVLFHKSTTGRQGRNGGEKPDSISSEHVKLIILFILRPLCIFVLAIFLPSSSYYFLLSYPM